MRQRVVEDRNRITAEGVTAGIDFAFRIIERRCGRDFAEALQLSLEYDPEPISGGTPETARPEIYSQVSDLLAPRLKEHHTMIDDLLAATH